MGVAELVCWSWMLLFLHAFAWAQSQVMPDMIVVGSTIVPDDECTQYCLRKMEEGRRPGVNIKNCRKDCKNTEGDDTVFVGSTQFPFDAETAKCIEQMDMPIKKTGAWLRECRERNRISKLVEEEDFSSLFNDTFIDITESADEIVTAQNDSSVLLTCTIVNRNIDYAVVWMRQIKDQPRNVIINGRVQGGIDASYRIEGDWFNKSFHLRINHVRPKHAGSYSCQYNGQPFLSLNTELVVNVAASISDIRPTGFAVPRISGGPVPVKLFYNESDRVELFCDVEGSPEPNVTWRQADGTIKSRSAKLVIDNIQRTQRGVYTCTANNYGPGKTAEKEVEIIVQYQPIVTVKQAELLEPEGEYVTLECLVDAKPKAEYRWIKDNSTIKPDDAGINNNPRSTKLIIVSLNAETDYGLYYCEATNQLGTAIGIIEVSGRPRKLKIVSQQAGLRKNSYTLVWNQGDNGRPENPRSIQVGRYEIRYYRWWIEKSEGSDRVVITYPLNVTYETQRQYRMSYKFNGLKENSTYNVSISGKNKYGSGEPVTLQFCTAPVPKNQRIGNFSSCIPGTTVIYARDGASANQSTQHVVSGYEDVYITGTVDTTSYDSVLGPNVDTFLQKQWLKDQKENSANHHSATILLQLLSIFVTFRQHFL